MKAKKIDRLFLGITTFLILTGIGILASVSAIISQERTGEPTYYLFHQLIWGFLIGVILGFIVYRVGLDFFKRKSLIFVLVILAFMALVFIPQLSIKAGGAPRWVNLGFVTFQPSEFLKLAFIIYLAAWLEKRTESKRKKNWKFTLMPFLVILGLLTFLLIMQSDLSTLGVIFIVALLMYFSSGTPLWHSILIFLLGAGASFIAVKLVPYRMRRVLVFLNPNLDPMGMGYQIKQALIAVGSGGIFGVGLGMSLQKMGYLPQAMSDSIFAIFAEEAGLIGSAFLIFLFLIFLWRGLKIAKKCEDKFPKLAVLGIVSWICIQAFINIGAMIGVFPLTGIPLPFVSYGGSHIVAELIGIGIILNVSRNNKK